VILLGSVIKYLSDGSIVILHANGNVAVNNKNGMWINTNNKGKRKAKRVSDNVEFELDPLPCAYKEDLKSKCNAFFIFIVSSL
jgi:hypothetical protein